MTDFDEIYRQYVDELFRFCVRRVGRREIAEEITAETFMALYERLDAIDVGQLPGWLFTVARNRAMDYWRRQTLEQRFWTEQPKVEPGEVPSTLERWLDEQLTLKPAHRACLILRYKYGMERAEIAKATGMTEMQVKSALQYSLRLLRQELEPSR